MVLDFVGTLVMFLLLLLFERLFDECWGKKAKT